LPACSVGAPHRRQRLWWVADADCIGRPGPGNVGRPLHSTPHSNRQTNRIDDASYINPWSDLEWLPCSDGKARPTKPGLFPLAYGVPGRVGRLRAYGNAIVPQVAAEFIGAFCDVTWEGKR
jgi:DNA (cytosine-5)-methyltransferase 1